MLIAFDTGFQTGIAVYDRSEAISYLRHKAWDAPDDEAMDWISECVNPSIVGSGMEQISIEAVIAERITITAHTHKKGDQVLRAVEQIGYIKHLCRRSGIAFNNKQSPSEAKGFGTDKKLKAMQWWTKGSDHARDASRHLMLYLCNNDKEFASEVSKSLDG